MRTAHTNTNHVVIVYPRGFQFETSEVFQIVRGSEMRVSPLYGGGLGLSLLFHLRFPESFLQSDGIMDQGPMQREFPLPVLPHRAVTT